MKNLMTQTLAVALLSSSLSTFGVPAAFAQDLKVSKAEIKVSSKQDAIKNIMAEFSSKLEGQESQKKALADAVLALQAQHINAQDLVEFAASGMEIKEAIAFRSKMKEKLAYAQKHNLQGTELTEIINEVMASTSTGSNFLDCYNIGEYLNWGGWIAALAFGIFVIDANDAKDNSTLQIRQIKRDRVALQSELEIARAEGVPESSSYITRIKADLSYLNELESQANEDLDKHSKEVITYAVLAGVSASVATYSYIKCF